MANKEKEEKSMNIILKNEKEEKDEVVVSLFTVFKKLKKYFLIWIVTAVVIVVFTLGCVSIGALRHNAPLNALVSFNYEGIEKGLDPAGYAFDVNTIKNPSVIEDALTQLGYEDLSIVEFIRQGITVNGIIPSDAIDRITTYKSVYENSVNGSISAAQAMLDVSYYPTQYNIEFDYSGTGFGASEAAEVFNKVLECYKTYFFDRYGYKDTLGISLAALDYTGYDYAEAVDLFDSTLKTLKNYVNKIDSSDSQRFRSTTTGYSLSDLSSAISTIQSLDLDVINSYININNVTKDKDALLAYYNYKIESLTRSQKVYEEQLATIADSFKNYEKDSIVIFGNGTDNTNTKYTEASAQYDKLINQRTSVQTDLSEAKQAVVYYNSRIEAMKNANVGSTDKVQKVEADLAALSVKVADLVEKVNVTADEYYENIEFAKAYTVLVPATASASHFIKYIITSSIIPVIILEGLAFVIYFVVAFVEAIKHEHDKRKTKLAAEAAAASNAGDGDGDAPEAK